MKDLLCVLNEMVHKEKIKEHLFVYYEFDNFLYTSHHYPYRWLELLCYYEGIKFYYLCSAASRAAKSFS